MSHKLAKQARKQIKNYLRQKDMQNGQEQIQYAFKQLETYIQLSQFLTGKKPEKLELVEGFYNWYVQEVQNQGEAMGLKAGFKEDKVTFLGIPLEKKTTIVVPEMGVPKDIPNGTKETAKA